MAEEKIDLFGFEDENGQAMTENILVLIFLLAAVIGLRIMNFVLNKAYLDAINNLRRW